jgi:tRNA(Ile)-lysidine synthetase-like protein
MNGHATRTALAAAAATTVAGFAAYRYYGYRRAAAMRALEEVLEFWFDPTKSADELYEERWFVAANSQVQAALDEEVRKRFGSLLTDAAGMRHRAPMTPRTVLALIILLDQLSRHAHRGERAAIDANDVAALQLARTLLARGWDASLSTAELVFALMPLRHQPSEERLQEVLDRTSPRLAACEEGARLLQRFRRHTQLRLLHLQGSRGDPDDILEREDREHELDQHGAPGEALARSVDAFIREHCGARPGAVPAVGGASGGGDEAPAEAHPSGRRREQKTRRRQELLTKVRDGGGDERGAPAGGPPVGADASPDASAAAGHEQQPLIVSLSGGLDSMVLVHILLALKARHGYGYAVHAVHIDYANRRESSAEAAFVREWCEARGVGVHVRVVEEVTRGVTSRDEYEKRSREIRFAEYGKAMASTGARGVFFGHHEGDVHENVISNVMKGAQLLDVAGIAAASSVSGVLVYRPMLSHNKGSIYEYAHTYGIPYFKDTTPAWSTRGKLRNQLMPLLKEVYGEGIGSHLSSIAKDSAQCRALVESSLLHPFWASVRASNAAAAADLSPYRHMPVFFWREALRHVCEDMLGCGLVKERPTLILMERLQRPLHKQRDGWIALKRENRALLCGGTLIIFAAHLFPGGHQGRVWVPRPHAPEGTPLDAPKPGEHPVERRLGAWRVRLSRANASCEASAGNVLGDGAAGSGGGGAMPEVAWRISEGRICYRLPGRSAYAVGSTSSAQVEALRALKGETWGVLLASFPQIVPSGQAEGDEVLVELECVHWSE